MLLLNIYNRSWLFHLYYTHKLNSKSKNLMYCWVKKNQIPWNKPITGAMSASENYDYLNPTQLFDLCCSVFQLIPLHYGSIFRSSRPDVFLRKCVLNICCKFTREGLCQSVISINLQRNFI